MLPDTLRPVHDGQVSDVAVEALQADERHGFSDTKQILAWEAEVMGPQSELIPSRGALISGRRSVGGASPFAVGVTSIAVAPATRIAGGQKKCQQRSPAMAAGLKDHIFTAGELLLTPIYPSCRRR